MLVILKYGVGDGIVDILCLMHALTSQIWVTSLDFIGYLLQSQLNIRYNTVNPISKGTPE